MFLTTNPRRSASTGVCCINFTTIFLQIFSCSFVFPTKLLRGAHEKLDAEAMRVLNMSPDWTPGTKDGKPVPVSFTFPVNFEIPDSENK